MPARTKHLAWVSANPSQLLGARGSNYRNCPPLWVQGPALLKALVAVESGFNAKARSPANALGLTQVLPATARGLGLHNPETNLFHAELALAAGAAYLRQMWFEFGDWQLALAAYNAGPGAVRKHKGIPPYRETQAYVPKVLALYQEFAIADAMAR